MQQLDTQEDLMQDGLVDGGAEDDEAADDGATDADETSPMEGGVAHSNSDECAR